MLEIHACFVRNLLSPFAISWLCVKCLYREAKLAALEERLRSEHDVTEADLRREMKSSAADNAAQRQEMMERIQVHINTKM